MDDSDDNNNNNNNNNNSSAASSSSPSRRSSTDSLAMYDGVPELFAGEEEAAQRRDNETRTARQAERIRRFRVKVLDLLES